MRWLDNILDSVRDEDFISGVTPQQVMLIQGLFNRGEYGALNDLVEELGFQFVDNSGAPVLINSDNAQDVSLAVDPLKGTDTPAAQGARNLAAKEAKARREEERRKKRQMRRDKVAGFQPNIGGGISFGKQTNYLGWILGAVAIMGIVFAFRWGSVKSKRRRR
jgi:hypothetical protein